MFVVAFSLGLYLMKKMYEKEKVSVEYVEPLLFYVVIATVLGARLGEVFFYSWGYYQNHLIEILLPIRALEGSSFLFGLIDGYEFTGFRGLASHGAMFGLLLAYWLLSRQTGKSMWWFLDKGSLIAPLCLACIRLGNFMNSEIIGKATN